MQLPTVLDLGRAAMRPPQRRSTEPFLCDLAVRQIIGGLKRWRERVRSRRQLRVRCDLDDHILQDIGLTRGELLGEAEKPFWR